MNGCSDYSVMGRASPTTVGVVLLLIVGITGWEIAVQFHSGAGFIAAWIVLVLGGLCLMAFARRLSANRERRRAEAEFATAMVIAIHKANQDCNGADEV